jgi:hypothetical protein
MDTLDDRAKQLKRERVQKLSTLNPEASAREAARPLTDFIRLIKIKEASSDPKVREIFLVNHPGWEIDPDDPESALNSTNHDEWVHAFKRAADEAAAQTRTTKPGDRFIASDGSVWERQSLGGFVDLDMRDDIPEGPDWKRISGAEKPEVEIQHIGTWFVDSFED